jgi:isoquinoline 1-oxidoreductase beta subunit
MKRRHFIIGTVAASSALAVGWSLLPPRQRLQGSAPLPVAVGQVALNGWLKIGSDGLVTVIMAKSEMGQGAHTGLAMLLAEELDADWAAVRVEASPVDRIYANISAAVDGSSLHPDEQGLWRDILERSTAKIVREIGLMLTGGSTSIKDLWLPMRQAGASARAMLVAAAAQRWGVDAAQITVRAGRVLHADGRSAGFGELAADAARQALPKDPPLKAAADFKLIGQPLQRVEAAAKGDGRAGFGIDTLLPGLRYASVLMCPTLGGRPGKVDDAAARAAPGVLKVLRLDGGAAFAGAPAGVAVVADSPWHALRALQLLQVEWDHGPLATLDSTALMAQLQATLDAPDRDGAFTYLDRGDADTALAGAARRISADYSAPFVAHLALEPMNCTVRADAISATVWAPTQVPDVGRAVAARVLGLDPEQVQMNVSLLGGGFGRRLEVDYIAQAAQVARALPGVPVQTFWSREQDTTHDFYRPACAARFEAGFDAQGRLLAWRNHSAGPGPTSQVLARYSAGVSGLPLLAAVQGGLAEALSPLLQIPGVAPDKTTAEGAFDQAYEVPHMRVAHSTVDAGVPVGFWRSVGHAHQAFFKEGFIDEAAHAAGADPLAFRLALLQAHPRHRAVLERVAQLSGWGQPLAAAPDGAKQARGVALHQSFGSIVAQVAEVSVDAAKTIRVHRVCCVIDCGTAVNPNLIRQQLEGGIVFGLSAALYGGVTIQNGRVQQSNFHDQPILRFDACPLIDCDIIASSAHPEGVGEPGTPPIAPAVANALFALTGQRLRSLPLKLA